MHLVVVTSVIHFRFDGKLYAYGPYVREMEVWSKLFSQVTIAAPCRSASPASDCVSLDAGNMTICSQREVGGLRSIEKLAYLWTLLPMIRDLSRALAKADCVHVRCPGNLGLLGVLLAPLFSRYLIAKYAGQWTPFPKEPLTLRLQRWLLQSRWWRGPVTVYDLPAKRSPLIVPFFSTCLSDAQWKRAMACYKSRKFGKASLRVIFIGRLSRAKNADVVLKGVAVANQSGANLVCTVVGDGPEQTRLRRLAEELNLVSQVEFLGFLQHEQVLDQLERADILALVSESEGWPKAIVEAMAFGLICIGSDRGLVPHFLADGRGVVVPVGEVNALADALCQMSTNRDQLLPMSNAAAQWARQFSLERFGDELRFLLESHWHIRLADSERTDVANASHFPARRLS